MLERTRWVTTVYVDDKEMGTCRSLVAPHDCDLGILTPGRHRLSICVDNRMQQPPYRYDAHSVSDAEGSTWNGIVGRIELAATSPVWIDDAQVFPNVENKSAQIKVRIGNVTGNAGSGTLSVGLTKVPVTWDASGGDATIDVALPGATPWSEFTPVLQRLTVKLAGTSADDRHPRRRRLPADRVSCHRRRHLEADCLHLQDLGPQRNPLPLLVPARCGVHCRRRARLLLPARVRHVEQLR